MVANVLVDSRPRFAEFTPDQKQVWVSSEVGGTVAVIDADSHKILKKIAFAVPGVPQEAIQAVGLAMTADGKLCFVALGPANRVAVVDMQSYEVKKYLLVGQRVWHEAFSSDGKLLYTTNGVSNDMSVIDVGSLKVTKSVPVGAAPWGRRRGTVTDAALSVEHVSHSFGRRVALEDVSFEMRRGAFTVLLGPNGAGKTTLFALVTRLYHSRSGRIAVLGSDMRRNPSAALSHIGAVFQQTTLDLDLSVEQNFYYHTSLHGISRRAAAPRITAELERVGLADRRHDKARELSGGQRRRIELARALLHEPAVLLLDEPTVGLDIESRTLMVEHVRRLCRERDIAALWATHLIDEAGPEAHIIVLHRGRIRAQGSIDSVVALAGSTDLRGAFDRIVAAT